MQKLLFLLSSLLLVAVALAKANPSLAADCIPSSWCKDPSIGCTGTETYRGDLVCPDNGAGQPMSCCVPGGVPPPPPPPTCPGNCRTNCSLFSGEVTWSGGLTQCASTLNPICCVSAPPPGGQPFTGWCPGFENVKIQTPFGCLDITGKATVSTLLGWAVGIGGGIAFLLIVYAAFMMTTAAGDPKRIKAAQELLAAALGGLTLIVLAVVLLNFIGVSVLNLRGLGFMQ